MAPHLCPTCGRGFSEAGFCPFDGLQLVPAELTSAPTYLDPDEFAPVPTRPRAKFATADVVTEVDRKPELSRAALAEQIAKSAQATHDAKHAAAVARASQPIIERVAQPEAQVLVSRASVAAEQAGRPAAYVAKDPPAVAAPALPFAEYDALIGTTLDGRYKLLRKLGEGAMGVVFAVKHNVIERPLALKILRRGYARDAKVVERFLREAKAASRIGHPGIVEVTDFGTSPDGVAYAVMELLEGQTLDRAVKGGALDLARALDIAQQVARSLAAAHAKGVVHRDLKSENIFLVERDGRSDFVKVVDFGVAKLTAIGDAEAAAEPRLTLAGSIMGTPEYMAPEQAAGKADVDHRVDIYALGIIMFEMITGRMPFRGDTLMRTLAMQLFDPLPSIAGLRANVPVELIAVIERACEKQPEARFATMEEFALALERVKPAVALLSGGEASASKSMRLPPGMMAPDLDGHRPTPRRGGGAAMWFALALISIGFGVGGWALWAQRRAAQSAQVAQPSPTAVASANTPGDLAVAAPSVAVTPGGAADAAIDGAAVTPAAVTPTPKKPPSTRPGTTASPVTTTLPNVPARAKVSVRVYTYPEGGNIYLDRAYRGPSGVTIQLPYGTRGTVTCQMFGYAEGTAAIAFDGSMESLSCPMIRLGGCVEDIKNPYDKCPPASNVAP
ncbi:MAG: protein kinase [Myxococcales bacterium]|nr:protein kinase [Myxococcales bacterium]